MLKSPFDDEEQAGSRVLAWWDGDGAAARTQIRQLTTCTFTWCPDGPTTGWTPGFTANQGMN
ncbi:hypothetical protein GCM10011575_48170 [Microlunatus endophyticus]|uniref:Uncharacterized protein n=1 Tax=Microlunatus endophyticus TaxID=1716077 RepID=A0A917WAH9_9ACTN|nr:hypothetical protein GCM10011575_48170 [Microlunatus endophyticus]